MQPQSIKRIAIVGISGSGKSTFAKQLADKTGLPLYFMDQLHWGENWTAISETEWQQKEKDILAKDQWIIEGYIDEVSATRLQRAECIIDLDFSGLYCAWNGLRRWWSYRKISRPELPAGCFETLDLKFIWAILLRKERLEIESVMASLDLSVKLDRVKKPKDLEKYLKE